MTRSMLQDIAINAIHIAKMAAENAGRNTNEVVGPIAAALVSAALAERTQNFSEGDDIVTVLAEKR